MYQVETELTVPQHRRESLLVAARLYRAAAQLVHGYVRCDLFEKESEGAVATEVTFVLQEVFQDQYSYELSLASPHHRRFEELVSVATPFTPIVTRLRSAIRPAVSPPLPRDARPQFEAAVQRHPRREASPVPSPRIDPASEALPLENAARALVSGLRLRSRLERLELATATETQLFGGKPDPCLLFAVYQVSGTASALVGRGLHRLEMVADAPCLIVDRSFSLDVPILVDAPPARFVVIVVGVEENTGRGVQRIYQHLGSGDSLVLWNTGPIEPAPTSISAFSSSVAPSRSESVHLLLDDAPMVDSLEGDTWVGASAAVVEFSGTGVEIPSRHRLGDDAANNDWTAYLSTAVTFGA